MRLRPKYPMHFLLALVAGILVWYAIAGQRRENISVRGFRIPLTLVNIPRELVITSSVPETVSVQLRGPLSRALDARTPPEVLVDLSDARPGIRSISINENDIQLPPDVALVSVDPAEITLEIERLVIATLPIRAAVEGTPAPGFVLGDVRVAPNRIAIQGPGSLLEALKTVETSQVSVEGATDTVEAAVQPRLPHPLLRSLTAVPLLVVAEIVPETDPTPVPTSQSLRRGADR